MNNEVTIRFAERMNQLPPYLFGLINKIKMEKRWEGHRCHRSWHGQSHGPDPEQGDGKTLRGGGRSQDPPLPGRRRHEKPQTRDRPLLQAQIRGGTQRRGRRHLHHRLQGGYFPPLPGPARTGRYGPGADPVFPHPRLRRSHRRGQCPALPSGFRGGIPAPGQRHVPIALSPSQTGDAQLSPQPHRHPGL